VAETLAAEAAAFVRRRRDEVFGAAAGGPLKSPASGAVRSKTTPTDPVTVVDTDTERLLRNRLAQLRPGDPILGEEGGGPDHASAGLSGPADAVTWVLDPIDGTVNFVLGLPHYAVSIAAEVDGVVLAGAVSNPVLRETFHAHRGGGAFVGRQPLPGPRGVPLARAVLGTGFNYDRATRAGQGAVVSALLPLIGDIRRFGAASLDLCAVAAGRLDGYFEVGLQPWDHAAGVLIAEESGCRASGLRGRAPSVTMTAVAAPDIASELFALLERLGADEVSS
jgi:myo-inositol-1(or 4)-monophosphatase